MIICGDIHIKLDNHDYIDLLETQLIRAIHTHNAREVVLLGDILHNHEKINTNALNRALKLFKSLVQYVHLIILVGNHDFIKNTEFMTINHWMNSLKEWPNVTIVDRAMRIGENVYCPFVPAGRFIEAIDTVEWKTCKRIFAHQEFNGCNLGSIKSTEGDHWSKEYPPIISGHIHGRQRLGNIFYIGAPFDLRYSTRETKSYLLCIQKDKEVDIELFFPRKIQLLCTLASIPDIDAEHKYQIIIKDSKINIFNYQKTAEYEELSKRAQIIFQTEEKHEQVEHYDTFLFKNVVSLRDEYIYSAYQEIVKDQIINAEDILLV